MSTSRLRSGAERRAPRRDRQSLVLDAAIELFLANGFDQTSMDAIAALAGVSKTTVYAHYADKQALFRAVVERSAASFAVDVDDKRLQADQDPESRLSHLVLAVLNATTKPEFLAFLRVMVQESGRHPDLTEAMQDADAIDLVGVIASILEEEATEHRYSLSEPRVFATLLLRMAVTGPQLDSLLFPRFRPSPELLEAHARWVTGVFLRGIQPRDKRDLEVTPPVASYDYPWLPDTVRRP
jgi:AcrR family transcriptional regulator